MLLWEDSLCEAGMGRLGEWAAKGIRQGAESPQESHPDWGELAHLCEGNGCLVGL